MNPPAQDIDWIMQSQKVSDGELAQILASELGNLLSHAARFLERETHAEGLVKTAIARSVSQRHLFWGEITLRAFILRKLVESYAGSLMPQWKKLFSPFSKRSKTGPDLLLLLDDLIWSSDRTYEWAAGQPKAVAFLLLLRYGAGLDLSEIATIFGSEREAVRLLLRAARREVGESRQILLPDDETFPHKLMLYRMETAANGDLDAQALSELADHLRGCPDCSSYSRKISQIETILRKSASASWPDSLPRETMINTSEIAHFQDGGMRGKSRLPIGIKEAVPVALVILIVAGLVFGGKLLETGPGDSPWSAAAPAALQWTNVTDFLPDPVTPQALPALDPTSTIMDVMARLDDSKKTWSTLWAEVLALDYGPLGYAGQPKIYANRVWMENSARRLVVGGSIWLDPDFYLLDSPLLYSEANREGDVWMIRYGSFTQPLRIEEPGSPREVATQGDWSGYGAEHDYSRELFYPANALGSLVDLKNQGDGGTIAGRKTILIEGLDLDGRRNLFWIDVETGWVLRKRVFHLTDPSWAIWEVTVRFLYKEQVFPSSTFNEFEPTTVNWAQAPLAPDIAPKFTALALDDLLAGTGRDFHLDGAQPEPPLSGFDANQSRLTFKWSQLPSSADERTWFADLYGDNWFLGQVKAGDPWDMTCERSASGKYLVFLDNLYSAKLQAREMKIVSLDNPSYSYSPLTSPPYGAAAAFSPDSNWLAFSAMGQNGRPGVYILNLETHELWRLMETGWVARLSWSEDGRQVIVVGSGNEDSTFTGIQVDGQTGLVRSGCDDCGNMKIWAVQVDTGEIVTTEDFHNGDQGIFFPYELSGLEGCVFP